MENVAQTKYIYYYYYDKLNYIYMMLYYYQYIVHEIYILFFIRSDNWSCILYLPPSLTNDDRN